MIAAIVPAHNEEEHIGDCPPCVDFLKSLKASVRLAQGFHAQDRPGELPEEVREKLKAAWEAALQRRGQ